MKRKRTWIPIAMMLGACWPAAAKDLDLGLQASIGLAKGGDLRVIASGLPIAVGAQANLSIHDQFLLKPRLEAWTFSQAHQASATGALAQTIETKVKALTGGADILYRPRAASAHLAVGLGLYLIRWQVSSTDTLTDPAGNRLSTSGTSSWTRPGLGLTATWRYSQHVEFDARWITSTDGYQKLSNNILLGGMAWHF